MPLTMPDAPYHQVVRLWTQGGAALLAAAVAGVLSWSVLTVTAPVPVTTPRPGPVLESVTPAQLAAIGVRLDPTVQPVVLPDWVRSLGGRLPSTILLAGDAEAVVRQNSGSVHDVVERALAYATLTARGSRPRGPTMAHRLVWAIVGTRSTAGGTGMLVEVLWLVDAHSGRQLWELTVPAPAPAMGPAPAGGSSG